MAKLSEAEKREAARVAKAQAISILVENRTKINDRLTADNEIGNKIADMFGDSDEEQERYNLFLHESYNAYEAIIRELRERKDG